MENLDPLCEKLLYEMKALHLVAEMISIDFSSEQDGNEKKYLSICQSAIAAAIKMYNIMCYRPQIDVSYQLDDDVTIIMTEKDPIGLRSGFRMMHYWYRLLSYEKSDMKLVLQCAEDFDKTLNLFVEQLEFVKDISWSMKVQLIENKFSLVDVINQSEHIDHLPKVFVKLSLAMDLILALLQDSDISNKTFFENYRDEYNWLKDALIGASKELGEVCVLVRELIEIIKSLQDAVMEQLKDISDSDDDEIENIMAKFSNTCFKAIMEKMESTYSAEMYKREKEELIEFFKPSAWDKMDDQSKHSLVTAKIMYSQMLIINPELDFSGVCVAVSKTLEIELKKRFYSEYLEYLELNYLDADSENPYHDYPSIMLKGDNGTPTPEEKFTLGSAPYTMYDFYERNTPHKDSCKDRLIEYCRANLFSSNNGNEIWDILKDYADKTNYAKENFRNPACHTGELVQINAKDCFDFILTIEKVMLDSFDN